MSRTTGQWEALLDLAPRRTFDEETLTEIVRLRRELEKLQGQYAERMQYQTRYENGMANAYRYVSLDIEEILDGESDA